MNNKRIHDAIHNHIGEGRVFSKEEEKELLTKIEDNHTLLPKRRWFPELVGWGLAGAAVLLVLGIIGSQTGILPFSADRQPDRLDTSLLKESVSESTGPDGLSDEQREEIESRQPKLYNADSVEDALNALPFQLTLPENLPFEAEFIVDGIYDWHFQSNSDGKDISVEFRAANGVEVIFVEAFDFDKEFIGQGNQSLEQVELKKGVSGELNIGEDGGTMKFENKEGIDINIYISNSEKYDTREVLIDLADQMIK
ncbi:hypothetical protein FZC78_02275 [Rossellomorea vietnamensis]|uniref:DUF4367 domain-containing protein n=1 Tax=Rossellomorea vietnamensis TaxID=218284 RepID=A0A5D4P2R1_9BACI|nr:hypothetical protein [Rossellomorea vietnamensis]TYS19874.1 hypothetical protein FZC78_02275 [Rossellomorea vietnamensis]